jgi:asparaginyl-tRNA synthetase
MQRDHVYISELGEHVGTEVTLRGWLSQKRSSGKIRFLVLRDGTGYVQCVVLAKNVSAELFETSGQITLESSLALRGTVKTDDRAQSGYEIELSGLELIGDGGDFPIQPKEHGVEFLFDNRHLYLRSRTPQAILRIRHEVVQACRDFFYERGFVLIDSPILTPAACEGTTTLFETDYFGEKAFLAQSGQLYLEPACMAFGKVYCFGPTFRAEKSKTRRHLTEFWMIEPEVAFLELDGLVALAEDFVVYIVGRVLDRCAEPLKFLERDTAKLEKIAAPFPRLTYDQAAEILTGDEAQQRMRDDGAPPFKNGGDLGALDETILTERFDLPVAITHWPAEIKSFYMQPAPNDPGKVLGLDLLAPEGYGEIIGGSQRIHDPELMQQRIKAHDLPMEAFQWYLDTRRHGTVPHSGFGMGIERVVTWLSGIAHLREAIPYPRQIHRIYP